MMRFVHMKSVDDGGVGKKPTNWKRKENMKPFGCMSMAHSKCSLHCSQCIYARLAACAVRNSSACALKALLVLIIFSRC